MATSSSRSERSRRERLARREAKRLGHSLNHLLMMQDLLVRLKQARSLNAPLTLTPGEVGTLLSVIETLRAGVKRDTGASADT